MSLLPEQQNPTTRPYDSQPTPPNDGRCGYVPLSAHNSPNRPRSMGGGFVVLALVGTVLITAGIAYTLINAGILGGGGTSATSEEVAQIIATPADYALPQANDLAAATPESLTALLDSAGAAYYDATNDESRAGGGIDLLKLPAGLDLETAGAWYLQGIDTLTAAQATQFLYGSWSVSLAAGDAYDCRLRFADFQSTGPDEAVLQAQQAVGLANAAVTSQGMDTAGNSYLEGTLDADGTRNWRIASCQLTDKYSIDGLPASASYVVVTISS